MDRKLATIRQISKIEPIKDADSIELAHIDGWQSVVKKGEFKEGDYIVYCEIDSFLPIKQEFEFLRKSCYRKMGEVEGFRLKTCKMRGALSQGLCLPINLLGNVKAEIGQDVTEILGILKYEPPISSSLQGIVKGNFPSFIPKTDEERIQNSGRIIDSFADGSYIITEKLDGSSCTMYINNGTFGVCSRNMDLIESEDNSYWIMARKLDIENKIKSLGGNLAFQGELIGEKLQGNPYKIIGQDFCFYNIFNIDKQCHFDYNVAIDIINLLGLKFCPVIKERPETFDKQTILKFADGKSKLNENTDREGLVFRKIGTSDKISFKAISNNYLLGEK